MQSEKEYKFNDFLPAEDSKAKKEETELFPGDKKRNERNKNSLHWVSQIFIWTVGILAVLVVSSRMIHFFAPCSWKWLTNDQIQTIDKVFFSGTIGGLLTNYFKKISQ